MSRKYFETRYSDRSIKPTSVQANAKISYQISLGDGSTEAARLSVPPEGNTEDEHWDDYKVQVVIDKATHAFIQYWTKLLQRWISCVVLDVIYIASYTRYSLRTGFTFPWWTWPLPFPCCRSFDHCSTSSFTRPCCDWRLEQRASTKPQPSYNCSEFDSFAIHSD